MTEKRFTNHIIKTDADGTMHSDGILDANEDNKIIIWNYFYIASLLNQLNDENERLKKVLGAILLEVKRDISNTNQTGEIRVFINPNSFNLISEVLRKYGALKEWYE